jgi:hypothetical protein
MNIPFIMTNYLFGRKTLDKYMIERLKKINFLFNTLDNFKNTLNKGIWIIKLLSMLIILVTFCK